MPLGAWLTTSSLWQPIVSFSWRCFVAMKLDLRSAACRSSWLQRHCLLARQRRGGGSERVIATSSYWRNVFLFAAGRVFADKEHLRSDITTMCADLNLDTPLHEATMPGSALALDILRERVTGSQPAYTRVLADCACQILRLPPEIVRSLGLERLVHLGAGAELFGALEAAARESSPRRLSAVAILASLADSGDRAARDRLKEIVDRGDQSFKFEILSEGPAYTSETLVELLYEEIANDIPSKAISVEHYIESEFDEFELENMPALPSHFEALMLVAAKVYSGQDSHLRNVGLENRDLSVRLTSTLGDESEAWGVLAGSPVADGAWAAVKECAKFCINPNASSLANALEAFADFQASHFLLGGWCRGH